MRACEHLYPGELKKYIDASDTSLTSDRTSGVGATANTLVNTTTARPPLRVDSTASSTIVSSIASAPWASGVPDALDGQSDIQQKRSRNMQQPSEQIPEEILLVILKIDLSPCEYTHPHMTRVLTFSRVSARWRAIVLSAPSLWSWIHSRPPLAIWELFMKRSKDQPLKLFMLESERFDLQKLDGVGLLQVERWQNIDLRLVSNRNIRILSQHAAPLLESFQIKKEEPCPELKDGAHPFHIFQGGTPRLRRLFLDRGCVPQSFPMHNLTHFCIRYNQSVHVDDVLQVLSLSPNLEYLDFTCIKTATESVSLRATPTPDILLARLRYLRLNIIPIELLYHTARTVRAPACQEFEGDPDYDNDEDRTSVFSPCLFSMASWLGLSGKKTIRLQIIHENLFYVRLSDPVRNAKFELRGVGGDVETAARWMGELVKQGSGEARVVLDVSHHDVLEEEPDVQDQVWGMLMEHIGDVQEFHVSDMAGVSMARHLLPSTWPRLETLRLAEKEDCIAEMVDYFRDKWRTDGENGHELQTLEIPATWTSGLQVLQEILGDGTRVTFIEETKA